LLKFDLKAGDAADIKVTQVKLTSASSSAANYTLTADGETVKGGVSSDSDDEVTFSGLNDGAGVVLSAGESKTLYVQADISSSVTNSSGDLAVSLAADDITAEEVESGDSVDASGSDVTGRTVSFANSGTFTISEDNDSPSQARILLSNSSDQELMVLKAEADYEDLKVSKIELDNVTGTSSIAALKLYQDGVEIATENSIPGSTVEFDNLSATVAEATDSVFTIKADIAGIGNGAEDTASTDDTVSFSLATTTYEGVDSKNEDTDAGGTASKDFKVYASKVTAALASNQPTSLSDGSNEALKFTLTPDSNDNKTAQLKSVNVVYNLSGSATTSKAILYSGGTVLASSTIESAAEESGTVTLDLSAEPTGVDDISSGETYTVKFEVGASDADDKLTASISVNGGAGNDDITWNDYDTGSGGTSVSWIDLGEDSSVTSIENTINY
jgi:hypothetical protein